jgi:hypothetical protein
MKLCAQVTIDGYRIHGLSDSELKNYVTAQLTNIVTQEIIKYMTISSTKNAYDDSVTYTGTITNSNLISNVSTISNTGSYSTPSYSQINMRVVEYTKNGKVTRVELQKYDENDNDWVKIPRIQIEE